MISHLVDYIEVYLSLFESNCIELLYTFRAGVFSEHPIGIDPPQRGGARCVTNAHGRM